MTMKQNGFNFRLSIVLIAVLLAGIVSACRRSNFYDNEITEIPFNLEYGTLLADVTQMLSDSGYHYIEEEKTSDQRNPMITVTIKNGLNQKKYKKIELVFFSLPELILKKAGLRDNPDAGEAIFIRAVVTIADELNDLPELYSLFKQAYLTDDRYPSSGTGWPINYRMEEAIPENDSRRDAAELLNEAYSDALPSPIYIQIDIQQKSGETLVIFDGDFMAAAVHLTRLADELE